MNIALKRIGKHYNYSWVFRNLDKSFDEGFSYAITGPNGSGKSTLLHLITGYLIPSEGKVEYYHNSKINNENWFRYFSVVAPYVELIEEYTFSEIIDFHFSLKNYLNGFNKNEILDITGLRKERNKYIKNFSSGMKQRVKLALALFADTKIVLMDEPTSNLDKYGIEWYKEIIRKYNSNRIILIFSNQEHEYEFCDEIFSLV